MLIVFLVFISASIFASGDWVRLQAGGAINVAVAENGFIAIANTAGELWISRDAGTTWARNGQAGGVTKVSLNSDASILGIVNRAGELWVSRDMGSSWIQTQARGVVDVSVGRTNTFIANTTGEVFFSADLNNWTRTNASNIRHVVFGGAFVFLSDREGVTFVADFNNQPNMAYRRTQAGGVVDIDVAPNGHLWVVNNAGEMWFSPDRGNVWRKDPQASGVVAVGKCNKYTIIANRTGEVWLKQN